MEGSFRKCELTSKLSFTVNMFPLGIDLTLGCVWKPYCVREGKRKSSIEINLQWKVIVKVKKWGEESSFWVLLVLKKGRLEN